MVAGSPSAAYITGLPMVMTGRIWGVIPEAPFVPFDEELSASARFITPFYFRAMEIPIVAGRTVAETDSIQAQPVRRRRARSRDRGRSR